MKKKRYVRYALHTSKTFDVYLIDSRKYFVRDCEIVKKTVNSGNNNNTYVKSDKVNI